MEVVRSYVKLSPCYHHGLPGSWHMRFVDAVAWAQRHPSQEIYMNQAMVADLGSEALNQLKLNMTKSNGLTLVSPSLWMSSGIQAA